MGAVSESLNWGLCTKLWSTVLFRKFYLLSILVIPLLEPQVAWKGCMSLTVKVLEMSLGLKNQLSGLYYWKRGDFVLFKGGLNSKYLGLKEWWMPFCNRIILAFCSFEIEWDISPNLEVKNQWFTYCIKFQTLVFVSIGFIGPPPFSLPLHVVHKEQWMLAVFLAYLGLQQGSAWVQCLTGNLTIEC